MNKVYMLIIAILLVVVGLLVGLNYEKVQDTIKDLGGSYFSTDSEYLLNQSSTSTFQATLTDGAASSTMAFKCDEASQIDLELMVKAAVKATKYQWTLGFTNDPTIVDISTATSTLNEAWYPEDGYTVNSAISVTHGASGLVHYWTPGITTTSTKNITITPVAAKYCRIDFAAEGGNGDVWAAAVKKQAY